MAGAGSLQVADRAAAWSVEVFACIDAEDARGPRDTKTPFRPCLSARVGRIHGGPNGFPMKGHLNGTIRASLLPLALAGCAASTGPETLSTASAMSAGETDSRGSLVVQSVAAPDYRAELGDLDLWIDAGYIVDACAGEVHLAPGKVPAEALTIDGRPHPIGAPLDCEALELEGATLPATRELRFTHTEEAVPSTQTITLRFGR
jgi:hypothetical protein